MYNADELFEMRRRGSALLLRLKPWRSRDVYAYTESQMIYKQLGRTGLKVSSLCLGTMTFGDNFYGIAAVDQSLANKMLRESLDAGVNFVDTADVYSYGQSEEVLGRAIKDSGVSRESIVVATKVRSSMNVPGSSVPVDLNNLGLSRKHIMSACEASLRRLGTDYIDLYQFHGWDNVTGIEEALHASDDLVRQGKVRYIGCSNWSTRHLARSLGISAQHDWESFVSLQAYYSLVGRDLEHELLPLCREESLGVLVWSPLSGGFLSGKYRRDTPSPEGARRTGFGFPFIDEERGFDAVEALEQIANDRDATIPAVALAWLLAQPGVTSIIIGANKMSQLHDNLASVNVELSSEEVARLSATTAPHPMYPQWMIEMQNEGR